MGGNENPRGTVIAIGNVVSPVARTLVIDEPNTEYVVELPPCYGFEFRARGPVEVRFAFESGKVADPVEPYLTLPAKIQYYNTGRFNSMAVYFAVGAGCSPTMVEIITLE